MSKLEINVDWDKLTPKEKTEFLRLIDKSNAEDKPFNPFERVEKGKTYYITTNGGGTEAVFECNDYMDDENIDDLNYFNDKDFAKNQALRELLNRKLIKFSYENGGAEIVNYEQAYSIWYDDERKEFEINGSCCPDFLSPLFASREVAEKAIEEVVKPFMKEHPDFVW